MNKKIIHIVFIIFVIAVIGYVMYSSCSEGMEETVPQGPSRCGVDLPSCQGGLRCINGYCRSDVAPTFPPFSDLHMTPSTTY